MNKVGDIGDYGFYKGVTIYEITEYKVTMELNGKYKRVFRDLFESHFKPYSKEDI